MGLQEDAKRVLPFVQAMAEGKTVEQRLSSGVWFAKQKAGCWYSEYEYRIKPGGQVVFSTNYYPRLSARYRYESLEEAQTRRDHTEPGYNITVYREGDTFSVKLTTWKMAGAVEP